MKQDGIVYFALIVIILILVLFNLTEGNRHANSQDILTQLKADIAELRDELKAHDTRLEQHNKDALYWKAE